MEINSARSAHKGRLTLHPSLLTNVAFTMAEILLSLTIIGVVAAITLPSIIGNINERNWSTRRKALYTRMSQAVSLMPSLNGYGISNPETSAETFVTEGLSKVYRIKNVRDSSHLGDCGIPDKIIGAHGALLTDFTSNYTTLSSISPSFYGSYYNYPVTKAAGLETANGESLVLYYNPWCRGDSNNYPIGYIQTSMCANIIYDLNGKSGPNKIGKDMGVITIFNSFESKVVSPYYSGKGPTEGFYGNFFLSGNTVDLPAVCHSSLGANFRPANIYELAILYINKKLFNVTNRTGAGLSGSVFRANGYLYYRTMDINTLYASCTGGIHTGGFNLHCIER